MSSSRDKPNSVASRPVGNSVVVGAVFGVLMLIVGPAAFGAASASTRSEHSIDFTSNQKQPRAHIAPPECGRLAGKQMKNHSIQDLPKPPRIKSVGFQRDIAFIPPRRTAERHGPGFYIRVLFEALVLVAVLCGLTSILARKPGAAGSAMALLAMTVVVVVLVGVVEEMAVGLARAPLAVTPQTTSLVILFLVALGAIIFALSHFFRNLGRP
jgi:hypothetical protein